MTRTAVLNVVGLTPGIVNAAPQLARWAAGAALARIRPAFPAVTCTAQSNYLTGLYPSTHGIVGNGWYAHEDAEIKFWKQSNRLVQAPKIWERARELESTFTCANLFWWYNMYSTADLSVTPRPMYPADGRKLPDVYTTPANLRDELQRRTVRERRADLVRAMADHENRPLRLELIRRPQEMLDERPPRQRMQHFRPRRLHARALACGQDDDVKGHFQ